MEVEKRFSDGFCKDLTELMIDCFKADTDSLTLELRIDGNPIDVDMTFRPHVEVPDEKDR